MDQAHVLQLRNVFSASYFEYIRITAHSTGLVAIPLTHTHDCSLSWLGIDTANTYTCLLTFMAW